MRRSPVLAIASIVCLLVLASCTSHLTRPQTLDSIKVFPPPPDTARIQFLTKFSSALDVTGKQSGLKKYVIGDEEDKGIVKPYGLALRNGRIYVCDTMEGLLEIIDLEKKRFDYFRPKGYGLLKKPINCFVDDADNLYVADAARKQVVVFNPDLTYKASFGEANNNKPTDVSVSGEEIFVTDLVNNKIHVYSKDDYHLLRSFPDVSADDAAFLHTPTNLSVTSDLVYVSDFGEFNVKVFTKNGKYIRSIGSYGKALGQFVRPKGIALDKDMNLLVVDAGFENVQMFDQQDHLLMFFGGEYQSPGDMWLPAQVIVDYDNLKYFQKYVYKGFTLKHLILVTNQYGPDKISVYGYVGPESAHPKVSTKIN